MNAQTCAKSFAVLAWLGAILVVFALVARVSWTAALLFAGAALVSLACAVVISRRAS